MAGVAEDGNHALDILARDRRAVVVHRALADVAAARPGAVADKVHPAPHRRDGGVRKLKVQALADKRLDAVARINALLAREPKQHGIINIAAVAAHLELALDVVIQRIEIDQRVELRQ